MDDRKQRYDTNKLAKRLRRDVGRAIADFTMIESGDRVNVFNDQGSVVLTAKATERIMPGVVCMAQGAWVAPDENGFDRGGCASTLLPEEHSPCGAFVTSGFWVEIEKVGG